MTTTTAPSSAEQMPAPYLMVYEAGDFGYGARVVAEKDAEDYARAYAAQEVAKYKADAERWREVRRVFHVDGAGQYHSKPGSSPETLLLTHWRGWVHGKHDDVTSAVDAMIAERARNA